MSLNKQQQAVVSSNARRILCLAGAGTGKTYTMIARIRRLVADGVDPRSILVLTFTNAAAFEMEQRYSGSKMHSAATPKFGTFHSFCYGLISQDKFIRTLLSYSEIPSVATEAETKHIRNEAAMHLGYKLSEAVKDDKKRSALYAAADRIMKQRNLITFDKMCYDICSLFVHNNGAIKRYKDQYKYVFVDEQQDTDPKQQDFVMSFDESNIMVVGDALQCQPAGTQIALSDWTTKPIEEIQVGDYVVTYNRREGRYVQNLQFQSGNVSRYAKQVTGVACRYADNIVKVSSAYHSSSYTKDHITYAKIHYEGNETKYVVYLMRNSKGWWRVGSTSLFLSSQGNDFGPRSRLKSEHGDAVWILDVVPDKMSAWMNEQIVAYKYGIPQSTWEHANARYTQSDLARMYEILGDLTDNAKTCLSAYNRDIDYPFWTVDDLNRHFSKLHLFPIHVGNLIPGVMDIVVPELACPTPANPGRYYRNTYEQIEKIEPVSPQLVYSLEVADYHNYVADGVLTHNCLYRFRGADSSIIKSLSVNPEWEVHKLSENYRSTVEICEFANSMSTYADNSYRVAIHSDRHGADVVVIDNYTHNEQLRDMVKRIEPNTAILCRSNAEVAEVCEYLTHLKIAHTTSKSPDRIINLCRSITDSNYLVEWAASLLPAGYYEAYVRQNSIEPYTEDTFFTQFSRCWAIREIHQTIQNLRNAMNKDSRDWVFDFEGILECEVPQPNHEECFKDWITRFIDSLGGDDPDSTCYVGTIHSVKGLEFDNVIVLDVGGRSFRLKDEDNLNVYYVAITRAKNHLTVYKGANI